MSVQVIGVRRFTIGSSKQFDLLLFLPLLEATAPSWRCRESLTDFLALPDAERAQLQAEDEVAEAESRVFIGVVAVYKALGGIRPETAQ